MGLDSSQSHQFFARVNSRMEDSQFVASAGDGHELQQALTIGKGEGLSSCVPTKPKLPSGGKTIQAVNLSENHPQAGPQKHSTTMPTLTIAVLHTRFSRGRPHTCSSRALPDDVGGWACVPNVPNPRVIGNFGVADHGSRQTCREAYVLFAILNVEMCFRRSLYLCVILNAF